MVVVDVVLFELNKEKQELIRRYDNDSTNEEFHKQLKEINDKIADRQALIVQQPEQIEEVTQMTKKKVVKEKKTKMDVSKLTNGELEKYYDEHVPNKITCSVTKKTLSMSKDLALKKRAKFTSWKALLTNYVSREGKRILEAKK